jgi:hypothetical protein
MDKRTREDKIEQPEENLKEGEIECLLSEK